MTAWQEIDHATMANGDVLTLRRRGADFEIRLNLYELMSSRNPVSERAMAAAACARVDRETARVLIGGLGMGYTLRAVLDEVGDGARVTVAELVPAVVTWNRGPLADLAARPLDDPRVNVFEGDVAAALGAGGYDVILLDVDNGPEAVLFDGNAALYGVDGLRHVLAAVRPGGVLAVWSADRSTAFESVLDTGGFSWRRIDVDVTKNVVHAIYLLNGKGI